MDWQRTPNPPKFSPAKVLCYTVCYACCSHVVKYWMSKNNVWHNSLVICQNFPYQTFLQAIAYFIIISFISLALKGIHKRLGLYKVLTHSQCSTGHSFVNILCQIFLNAKLSTFCLVKNLCHTVLETIGGDQSISPNIFLSSIPLYDPDTRALSVV